MYNNYSKQDSNEKFIYNIEHLLIMHDCMQQ